MDGCARSPQSVRRDADIGTALLPTAPLSRSGCQEQRVRVGPHAPGPHVGYVNPLVSCATNNDAIASFFVTDFASGSLPTSNQECVGTIVQWEPCAARMKRMESS